MSISRKLLAVERTIRARSLEECRLCRGHPHAIFVRVMHAPGTPSPARVLTEQIPAGCLAGDGLHCRRCGKEAEPLVIERPG